MGYDQEIQNAWNPFSSSREWTPLQANAQHPGHYLGANESGLQDNSHPAGQDHERWRVRCLQEYNCWVWGILGWTSHSSRYCQMIRVLSIEKRMEWARENLHKRFENIVFYAESLVAFAVCLLPFWGGFVSGCKFTITAFHSHDIVFPCSLMLTVAIAIASGLIVFWDTLSSLYRAWRPKLRCRHSNATDVRVTYIHQTTV